MENEIKTGRIDQVNIDQQMRSAYIDYSMSVIVSRALPDVRDGFKACAQESPLRNGRPWPEVDEPD